MIHSYIKSALRNLVRFKFFTLINVIGLGVGLGASILIAMWVFDELSYDRFHEKADRIFRVERDIFFNGQTYMVPVTGAIYGTTIKKDYPDVIDMVRVDPIELSMEDLKGNLHKERVFFVDNSIFDVFTFPLEKGNPKTAMTEPRSIVLTQKAASKYFGNEDPLNQTLRLDIDDEMKTYKVTGVLKDIPKNKHFQFEILASFSSLEEVLGNEQLTTWLSNYLYTYVLLRDGIDKKQVEDKLDGLVEETIFPAYAEFTKSEGESDARMHLFLRPVTGIHLKSGLMWDIEPQGDITSVYIFSIVAILILLIACFNFMNLSTALVGKRSLEIGIRKTVGSSRGQIMRQFLGESIITAIIAFVIGIGLIEIFLPAFNNLTDKTLSLSIFGQPDKLAVLALIVIGTGIISGIYPSFYLSSIKPIVVLKSRFESAPGKISFRQILVILQFTISIALIIGTATAYQQLNYIQNKPLGYTKENMLVIPVESNYVQKHYDAYKNDLLTNPDITHVTMSQKVPAERDYSDTGWETDIQKEIFLSRFIAIDYDFFDTYGLKTIAGRPFSREFKTDETENHYILNETAVKKLGFSDPKEIIGRKYYSSWIAENLEKEPDGKVIGVVKDFHFQSLKNKIEPLTLFITPSGWMSRISVSFEEGKDKEIIKYVEDTWKKHFPGVQFDYSFIEDQLKSLYTGEQKMQSILVAFTILAIFVACLGLFGLATFIAQQKIKEIGIRKVMGASVGNIVVLLTRSFSKWVLLANVLAWPLSWYLLSEWLANFNYRIIISIWVFIGSGILALVIAIVTVSYRAYRAGTVNPADALRYE